jgi:hypothetical protein
MKEEFPEPLQNSSVYQTEGELEPRMDRRYPFNHYVDENEKSYFGLSDRPKDQFLVSQLAALAVPVSNVFQKDMPDGQRMYFSPNAADHPQYDESKFRISPTDHTLLGILFNDNDHDPDNNYEGGVFYDFGTSFLETSRPITKAALSEIGGVCEWFKKTYGESVPELVAKITSFQTNIEGKGGIDFITAILKKSNYKDAKPEIIQQSLLARCDTALKTLR